MYTVYIFRSFLNNHILFVFVFGNNVSIERELKEKDTRSYKKYTARKLPGRQKVVLIKTMSTIYKCQQCYPCYLKMC